MQYFIDNEQVTSNEFYSRLKAVVEMYFEDNPDKFDDFIYDEYQVVILGQRYNPVDILKELNSELYQEAFDEWIADMVEEYTAEVQPDNDYYEILGINFRIRPDDEEDEDLDLGAHNWFIEDEEN